MIRIEKQGDVLLIATTLLASAGWLFSKEAIQGMPASGFIALRFAVAAACLLPFCYRQLFQLSLFSWLKASAAGVLMTLNLVLWIKAISLSQGLGEGAFIMSLSMLLVPLLGWLFFREKPLRQFWLALPIALVGLMCLTLNGSWVLEPAQLLFFLSALSLACLFNLNNRLVQQIPALPLTCIQMAVTSVLAQIYSMQSESWPAEIDPIVWGWFAASVLLATSLRYVLQLVGQKFSQLGNAALIMILEPVWTVLLSWCYYNETLPTQKMLGCSLILLALISYRGHSLIQYLRLRQKRSVSR